MHLLGVILTILVLDNRKEWTVLIRCYLNLLYSQEDLYLKTAEDQEELQVLMYAYLLYNLFGTKVKYTTV